ncbi:D-3-phosphoglycerate dehydrogenase [Solirubrobacter pauli]|uniref:D-3-phosphoglycerate dehydrogenase n=1 Tax=Solirubrobacter pauli TaxID=166793 RepID=A0A660L3C6_9ACTN|nr:phosphoglycerate dehydrogenase [Solirubrobacter pauli]RKQ87724.1 D-3-phosphoglycerate dehydrogenase [Solirubrobacter pauli]
MNALTEPYKVLVAEKIAATGVDMLKERFDVEVGTDWTREELLERISGFHGILIRSATKLDAEVLERADNLKVVGRAGVGVDNVDVQTASKKGIIVANAPEANTVAAAEHTVALILALARNIPQAHASLTSGKWERSKLGGTELDGKTLGVLGFGRIGQLVAIRARAFGMRVIAFDPFTADSRYREIGAEKAENADEVLAAADFLTLHLPKTPETQGFINSDTLAKTKDGVRLINVARGPLIVDEDLQAALDSGKVAGAALDVFTTEPITEHPLFSYPNVIVTPHLGASTAEAQDRAGVQTAEQVVAALTGGSVTTAVNIPAISAEDMEVLGPFVPLAEKLGKIAASLADSVERVEIEHLGRIAERDTRLLTLSVLTGLFAGRTEEAVNLVNAPALAEERGIQISETRETQAKDYADLVRVTLVGKDGSVRVVGTTLGQKHRPHLLEAWGQRFNLQIDDPYLTLFRYSDVPGMVGRVGSSLGEAGVNISAAAVGRQAPGEGESSDLAVMAITTDGAVPEAVIDQIAKSDGFVSGRSIEL